LISQIKTSCFQKFIRQEQRQDTNDFVQLISQIKTSCFQKFIRQEQRQDTNDFRYRRLIEILQKQSHKGDLAVKQIISCGEEPRITVITLHEVLVGLHKCGRLTREFLEFPVIEFTKKDAVLSSKLEFEAEKNGKPASRADVMIAAIAMNNRLSVYTCNVKHFNIFETQGVMLFKERHLE